MAATAFDQAVRRLAQYRPFDREGEDVAAAISELMLAAAAVQDGAFDSLAACQQGIKDLWGIEVEIDELRAGVEQLEARSLATRQGGGFGLTEAAGEQLRRREAESEEMERTALAEWATLVRAQFTDLTEDDIDALKEDLHLWLSAVIARHGVESALLLYPENPRAHELFASLERMRLDFLPERPGRCGEVRDWALQMFVRTPTMAQRTYLAGLLNTAFHLTVLTLDPDAGQVLREHVTGHRVYLDTNVIYALIGLGSSATETIATVRLLELTRSLGYELAVTSWTVRELRTSLRAAQRRLNNVPLPRQDLAELMALKTDESGVTKAYWMRYRETGIRPKDFFEYYDHVETLLDGYQVRLVDEGCVAVDQRTDAIDEQLVLLERFVGGRDKEQVILEHDVKHRLLIERLRGDGNIGFANARYWFLTRDTKLPRYAMVTPDGAPSRLPFCVGTSAWLQVIRAFKPRTDDFDQSLTDLLATPYLRYRGGPGVRPDVVDAVVARVDHYKGATPALAAEVLADTALTERIGAARNETEQIEQIEIAFIAKSDELRARAEAAERRETEARADAERAAAQLDRRDSDHGRERSALERELRAAQEKADLEQKERERLAATLSQRKSAKVDEQRDQAPREPAAQVASAAPTPPEPKHDLWKRRFEMLAGLVLLAVSAAVVLAPLLAGWVSGKTWSAVLICVGAAGATGAVRLLLGPRHGPRVIGFGLAYTGIVSLVLYFVDK